MSESRKTAKRNVIRFQQVSRDKLALARQMRRNMTPAEKVLWNALRGNKVAGLHFRRQQVIDGFIADFYCASRNLVIEADGGIHQTQQEYDDLREKAIRQNSVRIIRFSNERILQELPGVIREIEESCK